MPDGVILRKFVDTNDDNVVDQWSYYKDGLEVYRDIDSELQRQGRPVPLVPHRRQPLGPGHERGRRDRLLEVDLGRGSRPPRSSRPWPRATPTASPGWRSTPRRTEVAGPGQGQGRRARPRRSPSRRPTSRQVGPQQKTVTAANARGCSSAATRPGMVPAGTDGSTKDLRVYENVVAIVRDGGKHGQVQIGTLVQVGDAWRVIDLPQIAAKARPTPAGGLLLPGLAGNRSEPAGSRRGDDEAQKLLADLEDLDKAARQGDARPSEQASYTAAGPTCWNRSPRGQERRRSGHVAAATGRHDQRRRAVGHVPRRRRAAGTLFEKLQKNDADKNLAAYVKFRQLTAAYALSMQAPRRPTSRRFRPKWLKRPGTVRQRLSQAAPTPPRPCSNWRSARSSPARRTTRRSGTSGSSRSFPIRPPRRRRPARQTRLDSVGKAIALSGQRARGQARSIWPSIAARSC